MRTPAPSSRRRPQAVMASLAAVLATAALSAGCSAGTQGTATKAPAAKPTPHAAAADTAPMTIGPKGALNKSQVSYAAACLEWKMDTKDGPISGSLSQSLDYITKLAVSSGHQGLMDAADLASASAVGGVLSSRARVAMDTMCAHVDVG